MRLTLEIVAKTLFDAEIGSDSAEASAAMETLMQSFIVADRPADPRPRTGFPPRSNLRVERAARRLDRIILAIIAERRQSGEDRGDLLSMLLHAQDEESGRRMTDPQLRDEAMTLFMAGHETTANTLAWAWYLLSEPSRGRGEAARRARRGPRRPAPDLRRPAAAARTPRHDHHRDPAALSHRLDARPRERSSRSSSAATASRSGTTVFMPQWTIHRDPRWFDDPESFRPRALGGRASRRSSPATPTSPSAAARGSASATTSP